MNDIKRVILKLSGEALSGDKKSGYDDELIMDIAGQVKQIIDKGINVGVVIGGGNYWRGRSNDNIDRTKADQIGMPVWHFYVLLLRQCLNLWCL